MFELAANDINKFNCGLFFTICIEFLKIYLATGKGGSEKGGQWGRRAVGRGVNKILWAHISKYL